MSDLLQHPVLPTSHQRRSQKLEFNVSIVNKTSEPEIDNKKKRLIKSKSDSQKLSSELNSIELVKNIKPAEIKVGRDECTNTEMLTLEKKITKITNPRPLTAKIQSVHGRGDQTADGKCLKSDSAQAIVQATKEDDSDQFLTSADGSISCRSSEGKY